jgi:hypothetical protein
MAFSQKSSKSYKTLKIKRKILSIEDTLSENDLILEQQGNYIDYLKSNSPRPEILNNQGSFTSITPNNKETFVSPDIKFVSKTPNQKPAFFSLSNNKPQFERKTSIKRNTNLTKLSGFDYQNKFENMLLDIQNAKISSQKEEEAKMQQLSPREQVILKRQDHVLQNYKKTEKYWETIGKALADKSHKKINELLTTNNESSKFSRNSLFGTKKNHDSTQDKLIWYMTLRESPQSSARETYLPIGHELSGLYTRIKSKPSEDWDYKSTPQPEDLQVTGKSKLPLEIQAVRTIGYHNLRPELLNKEQYEEVILEHYDKKSKGINIKLIH